MPLNSTLISDDDELKKTRSLQQSLNENLPTRKQRPRSTGMVVISRSMMIDSRVLLSYELRKLSRELEACSLPENISSTSFDIFIVLLCVKQLEALAAC